MNVFPRLESSRPWVYAPVWVHVRGIQEGFDKMDYLNDEDYLIRKDAHSI